MAQRLFDSCQCQSELMYDLSAILIHRGAAVSSGHYVAHIKDEYTGFWWEFDDEHVSKLGLQPFGEGSSSSSAKPVPTAKPLPSETMSSVGDGNHINNVEFSPLDLKNTCNEEMFSSADAYMLMYSRRLIKDNGGNPHSSSGATNMDANEEIGSGCSNSLPLHLSKEIKELNTSYDNACQEYLLKKEKEMKAIKERREEVKFILSEAFVRSLDEKFFWIATGWLRHWADSVTHVYVLVIFCAF